MARRGVSETLTQDVHRSLRSAILRGEMEPGLPLRPTELSTRLQASISVVREALTRLVEQRLVSFRPNRGFNVVELSHKDLEDLIAVRVLNEVTAVRLATDKAGIEWQAKLLAAHHLMANTKHFDDKNRTIVREEWSQAHTRFHSSLFEGCDNPLLVKICTDLFDASELYRRWSVPSASRRRTDNEHQDILSAVLTGDADKAAALYEQHIRRTVSLVLNPPSQVDAAPAKPARKRAAAAR